MPEMHLQNFEKLQSRKKRRKFFPGSRVFASGEDSRTLRLASQLADLRAVNADLHLAPARDRFEEWLPLPRKKDTRRCPYVAGVAGFGPTSEGVKVPCLTAWLYPCILICRSYFNTILEGCQYQGANCLRFICFFIYKMTLAESKNIAHSDG